MGVIPESQLQDEARCGAVGQLPGGQFSKGVPLTPGERKKVEPVNSVLWVKCQCTQPGPNNSVTSSPRNEHITQAPVPLLTT